MVDIVKVSTSMPSGPSFLSLSVQCEDRRLGREPCLEVRKPKPRATGSITARIASCTARGNCTPGPRLSLWFGNYPRGFLNWTPLRVLSLAMVFSKFLMPSRRVAEPAVLESPPALL